LKEKRIAGAGLDVYQNEPMASDDPLLKLGNVVLTPHIGSGTVETRLAMASMAVEDVIRVLKGRDPVNVVNSELLAGMLCKFDSLYSLGLQCLKA